MNSLEFTQSLQDSMFIAALFVAALFIACTVSLALRNYEAKCQIKKLKKWRKFSEIEKKQKHEEYDQLATELAEERAFNDTQGDMHVRLLLKYSAIQDESDKLKSDLKVSEKIRSELYEEFRKTQLLLKVAETEITELKSKLERKRNEKGQFAKKTERNWTTATKEELLSEAKRRYPVGTRIKCLHSQPYDLIDTSNFELDKYSECMRHRDTNEYLCCVYQFGQWAEIIPNA